MAVKIEVKNNVVDVIPQEVQTTVEVMNTTITAQGTGTGTAARIGYITLLANAWVKCEEDDKYSQVVNIAGVTANDQVNINIDGNQAVIFRDKDIGFWTENEDGVVTAFVVGQKPTNDYTFQVTIVGVEYE